MKEFPEIGSFFSEPSKEDLAAFSRKETSPEDTYVMVARKWKVEKRNVMQGRTWSCN